MDEKQMLRIVEHYSRKSDAEDKAITVTRVADQKTVFIEPNGEGGRAIVMTEYKVDGTTYWAGYSPRRETVYISQAA